VLRGNDPAAAAGRIVRGQRVFCSDRGQRGGCGQTFPLFLADVLPRHTFNAARLGALLLKLLAGATIKAAAETLRLPFSLEAVYGIVRRCRRRLEVVRSCLAREHPAPVSGQTDPFLQTLEHLRQTFARHACALTAYQAHFQGAWLG
jgi:hypothetical protein